MKKFALAAVLAVSVAHNASADFFTNSAPFVHNNVGITGGTISGADVSGANTTATGSTTARTQADRAADVVNVKDFGAKCDGSTNDAAAFQAAANLGRKVMVPAGVCRINSTISIVNGTQFVGQGRPQQYVFSPTNGTTLDFVGASAGSDGFTVSGGGTVQMAYFADMQIQRAPGAGVNIACVYCTFDRVSFAYNGGNGATLTNTYLTSIRNSFFEHSGGRGLSVSSGTQGSSCQVSGSCYTTLEIADSEADHNASDGWYVLNQHSTTFINTGSDHNGGSTAGYGYNIQNSNVSFVSADAESNWNSGYYFYGSRVTMVNSVAGGNNTSGSAIDANHTTADNGSQVWIISGKDWLPSASSSLRALNSSNINGNNNSWSAAQSADGTSFVGNNSGIMSYKPTSTITFNNAAGANAYGLYGDTANTLVNVATGGAVSLRVNNSTIASASANGFAITAKTVSALPTCNTSSKGSVYTVSDSNTPTYLGTLTGGGSVTTLAMCDGTNWVAH